MPADIVIPEGLWGGHEQAALATWLFADGERVAQGSLVAEIMIEKTTIEIEAPASGALHIIASIDTAVRPGDVIGRLE